MLSQRKRGLNGVHKSPQPITPKVAAGVAGQPDEAAYVRETLKLIEEQSKWPGEIWLAFDDDKPLPNDEDMAHVGYLITANGNVDKLIAFIPMRPGAEGSDRALSEAVSVAQFPDSMFDSATFIAWDLRRFGHRDSDEPTPEFLYRLMVVRDHEPARFARRLFPFCRFRMAHLLEQFTAMQWPDVDRNEYPEIMIEPYNMKDGGGGGGLYTLPQTPTRLAMTGVAL